MAVTSQGVALATTSMLIVLAATAAAAPKAKEHAATAQERFGTLPAGIGLAPGQRAPLEVAVHDLAGKQVRLGQLVTDSPILLVFYRGGWCPYCNFQVRELTVAFAEFQRRGVLPVLVSVDRATEAATTAGAYDIPFPVLSDPDLRLHEGFGVFHRVDEAEYQRLRSLGMDLERASGRTHHRIAIPSSFVIDRSGIVVWGHADPDYKTRPTVPQLLGLLDELRRRGALKGR